MAKRRLKVYRTQIGFHDLIVAAPNQKAALKAWGVHQNLFASNDASTVDDEAVADQARRHPEVSLRRPIGGSGPYEEQPTTRPKLPEAAGKAKDNRRSRDKPPKPPPDRGPLDRAEASLNSLEQTRERETKALARRKVELDKEIQSARRTFDKARKDAALAVENARKAFRKAGGEP